jgi:hypothetical protein
MTRLNVYAGPAGFYILRGGRDDDVRDTASVALCERAGARPDLAWTHHDWAKALAAQGRDVEAKEHAEATRAIAEEIRMLGPDGPLPLVRKLLDG